MTLQSLGGSARVAAILALALTAAMGQALPAESPYSAASIAARVPNPMSVDQFLLNIRLALDKDFLLQPAFYDDTVLHKYFGGGAVEWSTDSGDEQLLCDWDADHRFVVEHQWRRGSAGARSPAGRLAG
jgi:hypothetical protein